MKNNHTTIVETNLQKMLDNQLKVPKPTITPEIQKLLDNPNRKQDIANYVKNCSEKELIKLNNIVGTYLGSIPYIHPMEQFNELMCEYTPRQVCGMGASSVHFKHSDKYFCIKSKFELISFSSLNNPHNPILKNKIINFLYKNHTYINDEGKMILHRGYLNTKQDVYRWYLDNDSDDDYMWS